MVGLNPALLGAAVKGISQNLHHQRHGFAGLSQMAGRAHDQLLSTHSQAMMRQFTQPSPLRHAFSAKLGDATHRFRPGELPDMFLSAVKQGNNALRALHHTVTHGLQEAYAHSATFRAAFNHAYRDEVRFGGHAPHWQINPQAATTTPAHQPSAKTLGLKLLLEVLNGNPPGYASEQGQQPLSKRRALLHALLEGLTGLPQHESLHGKPHPRGPLVELLNIVVDEIVRQLGTQDPACVSHPAPTGDAEPQRPTDAKTTPPSADATTAAAQEDASPTASPAKTAPVPLSRPMADAPSAQRLQSFSPQPAAAAANSAASHASRPAIAGDNEPVEELARPDPTADAAREAFGRKVFDGLMREGGVAYPHDAASATRMGQTFQRNMAPLFKHVTGQEKNAAELLHKLHAEDKKTATFRFDPAFPGGLLAAMQEKRGDAKAACRFYLVMAQAAGFKAQTHAFPVAGNLSVPSASQPGEHHRLTEHAVLKISDEHSNSSYFDPLLGRAVNPFRSDSMENYLNTATLTNDETAHIRARHPQETAVYGRGIMDALMRAGISTFPEPGLEAKQQEAGQHIQRAFAPLFKHTHGKESTLSLLQKLADENKRSQTVRFNPAESQRDIYDIALEQQADAASISKLFQTLANSAGHHQVELHTIDTPLSIAMGDSPDIPGVKPNARFELQNHTVLKLSDPQGNTLFFDPVLARRVNPDDTRSLADYLRV